MAYTRILAEHVRPNQDTILPRDGYGRVIDRVKAVKVIPSEVGVSIVDESGREWLFTPGEVVDIL